MDTPEGKRRVEREGTWGDSWGQPGATLEK